MTGNENRTGCNPQDIGALMQRFNRRRALKGLGWSAVALSSWAPWCGCSKPAVTAPARAQITTTVSMVTDLVKRVAGDRCLIQGLMGPGVDPHLYKATAGDVIALQKADITFYVGLHLEGKMQDNFEKMSQSGRKVRAITSAIPKERLLKPAEFEGNFDPHVWFDVELWSLCLKPVAEALSELAPEAAAYFQQNANAALKSFETLHSWAKAKAAELPENRRILVTSHDAYNYFGRAYGFQVVALQGISTVTEASLADLTRLVDFIKARRIPSIFVESSVPRNTIDRISHDAGVRVGGELFSDAMGTPGQMENGYDLGTYDGMIRHNLTTIVEGLK